MTVKYGQKQFHNRPHVLSSYVPLLRFDFVFLLVTVLDTYFLSSSIVAFFASGMSLGHKLITRINMEQPKNT